MDQLVDEILRSPEVPVIVAPQFKKSFDLEAISKVAIHVFRDEHKNPSAALEQLQTFLAHNALHHLKITVPKQLSAADMVCGAAIRCLQLITTEDKKSLPFECGVEPGCRAPPLPRDEDPVGYAQAILWPCNFWRFASSDEFVREYARWAAKYLFSDKWDEDDSKITDKAHLQAPVCLAWSLVGWIQDHDHRSVDDFVPHDAPERQRIDKLFEEQNKLARPAEVLEFMQEYLAINILPMGVFMTAHRFEIANRGYTPSGISLLQRYTDVDRVQWFQTETSDLSGRKSSRYNDAHDMASVDLLFANSLSFTQTIFHQYVLLWSEWIDHDRCQHLLNSTQFAHRPCRPVICHLGAESWMVHARIPVVPEDVQYSRLVAIYCKSFRESFMTWCYLLRVYFNGELETQEKIDFCVA